MTVSLRKAAIVLASLDGETADRLIDQMPPEQAARLRDEMARLELIAPAEERIAIDDFLRAGRHSNTSPSSQSVPPGPPGVELSLSAEGLQSPAIAATESADESAVKEMPARETMQRLPASRPIAGEAQPFEFLIHSKSDDWLPSLAGEHPQTIAVVVSHLPPPRAAALLARLPLSLQTDVLRRVARLEQADPAILREVESALAGRLAALPQSFDRESGLARAEAILRSGSKEHQQELLASLVHRDPELAARLQNRDGAPARRFAELEQVPLSTLLDACAAVEPDLLILALAGCDPQWVTRVLHQLPPREGRLIQRSLDRLGPTRLSDIEQARRRVLELAEDFARGQELHEPGGRLALTA